MVILKLTKRRRRHNCRTKYDKQKDGQNQKQIEKTERDWDKTQQGKTNRKKLEKDFKRDRAKKKRKKNRRMIRQKITVEITKNEIIVSFRKSEKEKKVR